MKKSLIDRRNKGLWLRLGGTLLTLVLLVVLLSQQGWDEIVSAVRSIPFWRFSLAVGLMLISRMAVCGRWHVLLKSAGLDISFKDSTRLTFSGLFASNFLPTTIGGDVVRLAGAVQLKYDVSISTASLIVDRLVGMAGMAMTLPIGISRLVAAKPISIIAPTHNPFTWISPSFISKNKWLASLWEKGNRFARQVVAAFSDWLKHPRGLLYSLICTWIHMVCFFGAITLLLQGLGETITFWQVAGLWSFVYFITQIPISINGYGLQEVSMAFIYSNLGGISYQSSLTIALLVRTLLMFASLPGALFVPGILEARARSAEKPAVDFPGIPPD
jgi:uncharacterized membrane protein YbhN (UPF0104 family)